MENLFQMALLRRFYYCTTLFYQLEFALCHQIFWLVKSMQDIKGNVNFTLFQNSSDNSSVQSSPGARNLFPT